MADILIVEDNKELGNLLRDFLMNEGYPAILIDNGEEAMDLIRNKEIALVILDIILPGMDGFLVCREIREEYNIPILIVSARVNKEDKLNGLLLGADDYIEKPYDIDILLAKIQGIFKRRYNQESVLEDGNIKIDRQRRILFVDDEEISLTTKEFELLVLLIENKGKTLKKEWLFNKIWGLDSFSEQQTLTVHIKWLREKIEKRPKEPKRIITVWGIGYRFE